MCGQESLWYKITDKPRSCQTFILEHGNQFLPRTTRTHTNQRFWKCEQSTLSCTFCKFRHFSVFVRVGSFLFVVRKPCLPLRTMKIDFPASPSLCLIFPDLCLYMLREKTPLAVQIPQPRFDNSAIIKLAGMNTPRLVRYGIDKPAR